MLCMTQWVMKCKLTALCTLPSLCYTIVSLCSLPFGTMYTIVSLCTLPSLCYTIVSLCIPPSLCYTIVSLCTLPSLLCHCVPYPLYVLRYCVILYPTKHLQTRTTLHLPNTHKHTLYYTRHYTQAYVHCIFLYITYSTYIRTYTWHHIFYYKFKNESRDW